MLGAEIHYEADGRDQYGNYLWFAWYPVKAYLSWGDAFPGIGKSSQGGWTGEFRREHIRRWRWVWKERVRAQDVGNDSMGWVYYLDTEKGEKVKDVARIGREPAMASNRPGEIDGAHIRQSSRSNQ
jgi:hypothetical protein